MSLYISFLNSPSLTSHKLSPSLALTLSKYSPLCSPSLNRSRRFTYSQTMDSTKQTLTLDTHKDHHDPHNFHQNVIVMRHGDRMDNVEPLWLSTAVRPWDPPLAHCGKVRAFDKGRELRNNLGFPIHRVFVSPFLRCIQTASEVISALCAVDDYSANVTGDGVSIDPSKIKVSIEYGLCEMLNTVAIRLDVAPKDQNFGFNISELEAMLPAGTVDHTVERVYQELPQWGEEVDVARARYKQIFKALADKFPSENLLLVTHGEGVAVSASSNDKTVYRVDYCAYSHLRRPIFFGIDQSFTARNFEEVLPDDGQIGISYLS